MLIWIKNISVVVRTRAVQRPLEGQKERGTWNTAFNRAVLLADMCIEMDASVLIQQQLPWRRFEKETQNRKDHFKFKC